MVVVVAAVSARVRVTAGLLLVVGVVGKAVGQSALVIGSACAVE